MQHYVVLLSRVVALVHVATHASLFSLDALNEQVRRRMDKVHARERAALDAALPAELRLNRDPGGGVVGRGSSAANAGNGAKSKKRCEEK